MIMLIKNVTLSNIFTIDKIDLELTVSFSSSDSNLFLLRILFQTRSFSSITHHIDLEFESLSILLASDNYQDIFMISDSASYEDNVCLNVMKVMS